MRVVWVVGLIGCGAVVRPAAPEPVAPPVVAEVVEVSEVPASAPPPPPAVLLVTDPEVLARYEALSLDRVLGAADLQAIRDVIARDLREHLRRDERSGVGLRHAHRLFDTDWLSDARVSFTLAGVVNRVDRRVFHPGTCGETRLIYRLGYVSDALSSRLPMTLNVVFFQHGSADCAEVVGRWQRRAEELADLGGPLAPEALTGLKSVEIDLQTVRWPGTVRPDLAGHAEYSLRVFRRDAAGALVPAPLENQPDVRIARDPERMAALVSWIVANAAAIEDGTALLPEALLATSATSIAPHGHARLGNRPFTELVDRAALETAAPPLSGAIVTLDALLRRLDGMSCTGCHQSRSLAGFHLLGDEVMSDRVDALASGISGHLAGELERRRAYVDAIASAATPSEHRGFPERGTFDGVGAHCTLGTDASFASWTCASGLTCEANGEPAIGVCARRGLGDGCEPVRVIARRDRERGEHDELPCPEGARCEENAVGFPGGLCTARCAALSADLSCGGIPGLEAFNACIGRREPFDHCLATTSSPSALLRCDAEHPCRDDYVCARNASGLGGCIPPYFLFQLRVDGHPL